MKNKYVHIVALGLLLLFSFCTGYFFNANKVVYLKDFNIYLNDESQIFRDVVGKKLYILEYDSNIYVPVSSKGLFMGYNLSKEKNNLYLNKYDMKELSIATKTVDSAIFTNDNLYQYDYTLFINWATWCPDCSIFLKDLNEVYGVLQNLNSGLKFQIIGLPMDIDLSSVTQYCKTLDFEFKNLIVTKEIENQLQTNIVFIPNIIVVNNKGVIIDTYEDLNVNEIITLIKELPKCNEC